MLHLLPTDSNKIKKYLHDAQIIFNTKGYIQPLLPSCAAEINPMSKPFTILCNEYTDEQSGILVRNACVANALLHTLAVIQKDAGVQFSGTSIGDTINRILRLMLDNAPMVELQTATTAFLKSE